YTASDEPRWRMIAPYVLHELAAVGPPLISGARLDGIAVDGLEEVAGHANEPAKQLLTAARIGYYVIVDDLLRAGSFTADELTAAAVTAIDFGHSDIARRLLDAGADARGGALH